MSFDLSALKFDVDTSRLEVAVKMVDELGKSVKGLKRPLEDMTRAADSGAKGLESAADSGVQASKKQTKQVDVMSQAVKAFYKEQDRLVKESMKQQEAVMKAGATMGDDAVKAYEKYLDTQIKVQQSATNKRIQEMERETAAMAKEAKNQQTILERQRDITAGMATGLSKGQATIVARAKAAGQSGDIPDIISQVQTQQKFKGGDPFDKSVAGLRSLQQELGQSRESYRQLIEYTKKFNELTLAGNGEQVSLVSLNKKETDNLYRDKVRLLEVYKQEKQSIIDNANLNSSTEKQLREDLETRRKLFKDQIKDTEEGYKKAATFNRPLADVRAVDANKKRDKLNYLARATSVQLGDIGVSLAGGQNPLTVFLQQGDQMRAIFGDIGREGHNMEKVLNNAFSQIVTGFRDVALKLGEFVLIAFKNTTVAMASMAMSATGVKAAINEMGLIIDTLSFKMGMSSKASTALALKFKEMTTAFLTPIVATGVGALLIALTALAVVFYQTQQSGKALSVALATSGAGIQMNKKEATALAHEMANVNATSNEYLKILTEIALASKIPQEAVKSTAETAALSARFLGTTTKEVVDQFAKLQEDPVKALTELGEKTGHVSVETIDYIGKLIKQGEAAKATAIAHNILAESIESQADIVKGDMTPLDTLWMKMKDDLTLLKEELFSLAASEEVVKSLTALWKTFASTVLIVASGIKMINTENSMDLKINATYSNFGDPEVGKKRIALQKEQQDKMLELRKDFDDKFSKIWAEPVPAGGIKTTEADRATMNANKEAIEAREKLVKLDKEIANKSDLSDAQLKKRIADKTALSREAYQKQIAGVKDTDVLLKLKTEQAEREKNIEEHFKPKKVAGGSAAIKDEINSRQQEIDNARKEAERNAKMGLDRIKSDHDRSLMDDLAYIDQKSTIEKKALTESIAFFEKEKAIAAEKVNSKKEVQVLEGKVLKAKSDIEDKELERGYAVLALQFKQYQERKKFTDVANNKEYDDKNKEIEALVQSNEQLRLQNELIGKAQDQVDKITMARQDEVITKKEEILLGLRGLEIVAEEVNSQGELVNVLEQNTRERNIQIQQGEREIEQLKRKKALTAEEQYKTFKTKMFGEEPSPNAPPVIGSATRAASKDIGQGNAIIAQMEAEKKLIAEKMNSVAASDAVREADQKRFDELTANIESLQGRLTLTLKITGLEDVASQMQGLAGTFTTAAQNNLAEVTKRVSLMGSAYKASGKEILKHAQDQANSAARQQKAIGNIGSAIKNYGEIEKKNYSSTSEKMNAQIGGYAELAGAAKGYFEEGSAGYEVLAAAEQAFRAIQLAMSIAAMVQKDLETENSITNNLAAVGPALAKAAAEFFANSTWLAFAGIAAMMAVMASFGGGGSGGGGGASSGGAPISASGSYVGTGTEVTATGSVRANKGGMNSSGGGDSNAEALADEANQAKQTAEAIQALNEKMREAQYGASKLEQDLADVKVATQGTGRMLHDLATQGMSESEIATYNYNAALRGQIMVLMDAANGTENASENMRDLANESVKLAIDLKRAQGDIAGANFDQMKLDTKGYTEAEIAVYDHNQALKAQIESYSGASSAASDAARAEEELIAKRKELQQQIDVLNGISTQTQIDRMNDLASTTDEATLSLMHILFGLQDLAAQKEIQNQIDVINGATTDAQIERTRQLTATSDEATKALLNMLFALQDSTALQTARTALQNQIDVLTGASTQQGLTRAKQLAETSDTVSLGLIKMIHNLEDAAVLTSNLNALMLKFKSPAQTADLGYDTTSSALFDVGIGQSTEAIKSFTKASSKLEIIEAAKEIYNLGTTTQQMKLALISAVSTLMDMKDATDAARTSWQNQLDILSEFTTQDKIDQAVKLKSTSDEATLSLMTLVFQIQNLESAASAANAKATGIEDTAMAVLTRSVDAQRKIATASKDVAQETVNNLTQIFDLLKSSVDELYQSVEETKLQSAATGNAFITNALSNAQLTGYLPDFQQLSDAVTAAKGGIDTQFYATEVDKKRDQLVLAGKLSQLKDLTKTQLSTGELALKVAEDQLAALDGILEKAQSQIDAVRGVDTSVMTISNALLAFAESIAQAGSLRAEANAASAKATTLKETAKAASTANYITDAQIAAHLTPRLGVSDEQNRNIYNDAYANRDRGVTLARINTVGNLPAGTAEAWAIANGLPTFANGGDHAGGWAMVGERGPELAYMPPARIYTAGDTSQMFNGSSANSDLIEEVKALKSELMNLRSDVQKGNMDNKRTAEAVNGNPSRPMLVEVAA